MIPVNEPLIGETALKYVTESVESGWVSSAGPYVEAFESGWANYCDRRHGVAVANGTVALQLAVSCLDLEKGDEVIIPSFTIISCALAVIYAGATPVLVDADPETWTMDVSKIAESITERTKAIMPVHIYGHPVDMQPVFQLADESDLYVIEDAAEAHGAEYRFREPDGAEDWRPCGSFGHLSCFSFYANKLVTTGEGGMVLTDDDKLAEKARARMNLCFGHARRFCHEDLGFNFRMTNLQAALGVAQLEEISRIVNRKRWMGEAYSDRLRDMAGLQLPPNKEWAKSVYWMYGVIVDESTGLDAEVLATELLKRGVETRPFFVGMHEQPVLQRMGLFKDRSYPVSERLSRQGLYLPSGLALTEEQIDFVCSAVREVVV